MGSTAKVDTHVWDTAPGPGTVLYLWTVMRRYGVSFTELGRALCCTREEVMAIRRNVWPRRSDPLTLQALIQRELRERGVTAAELDVLFFGERGARHWRTTPQRPHRPQGSQPSEVDDVLLPKQTLAAQAGRHFKLFRNPFDGPVERDDQFFDGAEVAYVREAAWQCATNSNFLAIIGESGAGKTTIQADLETRLAKVDRGIVVIKPGVLGMEEGQRGGQAMRVMDILFAIVTTLNPSAAVPATMQARTALAMRLLTASAKVGNSHLLVIEEAHGMPDDALKHLKRLHEMRDGRRALMGILLLAQPELKARLAAGLRAGGLREVAQRCEIVDLLPLERELPAYLQCRAAAFGRKLETIIDESGIEQLGAKLRRKTNAGIVSMTYPLSANNAITKAMNLAAEIGVPIVNADVVRNI